MIAVKMELTDKDRDNVQAIQDALGVDNEAQAISLSSRFAHFIFERVAESGDDLCISKKRQREIFGFQIPKKILGISVPFSQATDIYTVSMHELDRVRTIGALKRAVSAPTEP